ncbi:MAG: CHAT domain-containing protein, partial [Bacteroidales bacterium]
FATAAILEVYNEAIYVGKLLYEMTGDLQYLDKSFEFAESSKSFALFSEIKDVEAIEFSDIPHSVKEEEEDLIGEIQGYEEMLYEEQFSSDPDSSLIAFYRDKIFHLKDDYNDLLQEIELNYANYYELKYNPEFVSLKEVQDQLPYRDALIEYVLTDTMLITYIIDKKEINVLTQKIEPDFEDECLEYYRILYRQNFSNGVHDNYRRFVNLGRKFYRILIEPCMEYTDRKSLTIVPDGAITYLPFEGFLTEDVDAEYINYLTLPYMIREYSVGYSHSSTLLFSERLKTKSPENKVLAFAPEYTNPLDKIDSSWNRQADPDFLLPLPGSLKEVQSINETVPSRIFLNEKATESNFKKYASDYSILHLAMHTIMDDERPLQSLLAFTNVEESDTAEDNRLYAYEIYNMKLNAQMAVLSSCSSGFGKMQEGEGMMSLARGFIYAGCPCIVMTLWQVSDKSSSELMSSFYKYLKKGRSKQEAMRLAKIDYLENADDLTSNPYFWSGFVVVGDGSPVYHKTGIIYWLLVVAIFIGTIVFVQYRKGLKR